MVWASLGSAAAGLCSPLLTSCGFPRLPHPLAWVLGRGSGWLLWGQQEGGGWPLRPLSSSPGYLHVGPPAYSLRLPQGLHCPSFTLQWVRPIWMEGSSSRAHHHIFQVMDSCLVVTKHGRGITFTALALGAVEGTLWVLVTVTPITAAKSSKGDTTSGGRTAEPKQSGSLGPALA